MLGDSSPTTGNITLDLLITSGNPKGVEVFTQQHQLPDEQKKKALAEASIISAVQCMAEEADGGIDGQRFQEYFDQQHIAEYLAVTTNTPLLEKIVEVLYAGTNASMEAYAQITAVDVLRVPALATALRSNLAVPSLEAKMRKLIRSSYAVVFSSSNIDAETVNRYFPIINQWKDLVNHFEVAQQTLNSLAGDDSLDAYLKEDYNREFFATALDKLIELTNRPTISRIMHEQFGESQAYCNLVAEGKIEGVVPTPRQQASAEVEKAIAAYENNRWVSDHDLEHLSQQLKGKGKEVLSHKLTEWFVGSKTNHALALTRYEYQLYDSVIAERELTSCLISLCSAKNINTLLKAFELPEQLINFSRPELAQFAEAYKIHKATYKKRES